MRVSPDTKDALIFYVGLFGIIGQAVLYPFHVAPSPILLGIFGTMIGLGALPSILEASKSSGGGDDPPRPADKSEPKGDHRA